MRNPLIWIGVILATSAFALVSSQKVIPPKLPPFSYSEYFKRSSTFLVCEQLQLDCDDDQEITAEIVTYFGTKLVYTDLDAIGFVDVADPSNPIADGMVSFNADDDEAPSSVKVVDDYAFVSVATSDTSGFLAVVNVNTKVHLYDFSLPGQPDAVAITSGSGFPKYVAVAIENQGNTPGSLYLLEIPNFSDPFSSWPSTIIGMAGYASACEFPDNPEPEFVDFNFDDTKIVVTLQENNCNIVVDVATKTVDGAFSAGTVDLHSIDLSEDPEYIISQTESIQNAMREPDGVAWIADTQYFATANEGENGSGTRGFSIFDSLTGNVIYDSGNTMELEVARIGHYPDNRSGNKGNEPENVLYARTKATKFNNARDLLFVASERSSVVLVYDVKNPSNPRLEQVLPVGISPEGLAFDKERNLLIVASEKDDRDDKFRSSITLFELVRSDVPEYPMIASVPRIGNGPEGPFIPFSALSGLSAAAPYRMGGFPGAQTNILYAVEDNFYQQSRIFTIDSSVFPALITTEVYIKDTSDILSTCLPSAELSDVLNFDQTVNLDPKGIAVSSQGGFWIVSESNHNLLIKLNDYAIITQCVQLPSSFPTATSDGFAGVAEDGVRVVVIIQRAWGSESLPRIAIYNTVSMTWKYAFYPLSSPTSLNGGWVGISDIAPAGRGKFYVLERDNQATADAAIKRITTIDIGTYRFEDGVTVASVLYRDLIPDLLSSNGQVLEKVDGLAITRSGKVWISNDNDGVKDNSGEHIFKQVSRLPCGNIYGPFIGPKKGCSWVGKKPNTRCKRMDENTGFKAEDACPQFCNKDGSCVSSPNSPSASPNASPSGSPPGSPSRSPSAFPTISPIGCTDDSNWRRNKNSKNCGWVADKPDKRCNKKGTNNIRAEVACGCACETYNNEESTTTSSDE